MTNRRPVFALLALCWLGLCTGLDGHAGILNVARIRVTEDALEITTEVALREILLVHGLTDEAQGGYDEAAIRAAVDQHETYLTKRLEVVARGEKLTGRVLQHSPPPAYTTPSQTKYTFHLRYAFADLKPAEVTLRQNMLREFSVTGGHPWHVTYLFGVTQADGMVQQVSLSTSQDLVIRTGLAPGTVEAENGPAAAGAPSNISSSTVETKRFHPTILIVLAGILGAIAVFLALRKRIPPGN